MSLLRTVGRVLPPPQFITLPSVGIDISDSSLKYIQFKPDRTHGSKLTLKSWGDIDVPAGVMERGAVKDQKLLVEILKEVRAKTDSDYVRLSLPEERAYLFETTIAADTSFKEIRGLLEFKLQENVPLEPRDTIFDFDIIEDSLTKSGEQRISVTAYSRETINGFYETCRAAELLPLSFEVEAQAIARAVLPPNNQSTVLIVDFGKTRTGIGIVYKGVLMYTSTIDIGGLDLSSAVRRQMGNISEEEITNLKNTQGLVRGVNDSNMYDAILSTMSAIQNEINLRINYWRTKEDVRGERQIESIVLCGGSVNLRGLPGYLSETLKIRTERAAVWNNAFNINDQVPPIEKRFSYGYATAIGLALTSFVSLYE